MKKISKLLPIVFFVIVVFMIGIINKDIKITMIYDDKSKLSSDQLAVLYYDTGNGFSEEQSVYELIDNHSVTFSFHTLLPVKQLRLMPTRKNGQKVYVKEIDIEMNGSRISTLDSKGIAQAVCDYQEGTKISLAGEQLVVEYPDGNAWCYFDFQSSFVESINQCTWKMRISWIPVLLILLAPIGVIFLCKFLHENEYYKKLQKYGTGFSFGVSLLCLWMLQKWLCLGSVVLFWILPFLFWDERYSGKKRYITDYVTLLFSAVFLTCSKNVLRSLAAGCYPWKIDYLFLVVSCWMGSIALYDLIRTAVPHQENGRNRFFVDYTRLVVSYACVCITFLLYEYVKLGLIYAEWCGAAAAERLFVRFAQPVYLMNLLWGVLLLWTLTSLAGKVTGIAIYALLWLIVLIGNIIKIKFHDTMLTPLDFIQLSEAMRMAQTVLGTVLFYILIVGVSAVLAAGIVLLVVFRKKWIPYIRIAPSWIVFASCLIVWTSFSMDVIHEKYMERNIFYKGYVNEYTNEDCDGVAFYNLINLSEVKEIFMSEPEGYNEESIDQIKQSFRVDNVSKAKDPNVILIMAESLFDIENIPEVTFDQKIEPTLRKYKKGTLISPRYGGYTSAVEYEALTGLSLAYYPSAMVPYTTYFNSKGKTVPSIAAEFDKNGYRTYAIHPNDKTFYNRDNAYKMMGFQTFLDQSAFIFDSENTVAGTYLKDQPIADKIKTLMGENDDPVFAFAVTIAGHYMDADRYDSADVTAESDVLSKFELDEIEQQATALQETDQMFKDLVKYVKNSDEPTLLYIFGDHLPPLSAFDTLDYIQDIDQKYGTCLSAYSNYMDIEFPEYITPNQIAAQIMHDSGIEHSSYYNYIYNLRESYPVIHKEYCNVEDNPDLDIYRMIQYDIMFGKQYFYEKQ